PFDDDLTVGLLAVAGLILTFFILTAIYRLVPAGAPPLADLWPGALLAALGLAAARNLFARYVAGLDQYHLIYGSIGAVIVVLLWFYVSAAIFLFGAEVGAATAELRRRR
ncbi:MAG TPA: YhjD/YihY/BrkB family envelope integrity protein, partial [Bacillota bacterium]